MICPYCKNKLLAVGMTIYQCNCPDRIQADLEDKQRRAVYTQKKDLEFNKDLRIKRKRSEYRKDNL